MYEKVYELLQADKLSSSNAKMLIKGLLALDVLPDDVAAYAEQKGFIQLSDSNEIVEIVTKVLADNPLAVEDVRNGEMKAIGFLVGQVMKASQGKANPGLAQKIIKQQLS